jgi:hypothetical protein
MSDDTIGWAVLELMGHRKLAGHVKEATLAGGAFLRIDVCLPDDQPELGEGERPAFDTDGAPLKVIATQFYAPGAVYCITPTERDACLLLTRRYQPEPVTQWELPRETAREEYAGMTDADFEEVE